MQHEAKTLAGSDGNASGETPEAGDGEQAASPDGTEGNEAEGEKREMEKAMADAVAEQEALQAAAEDKRALGLSVQRVAELEVRNEEKELRDLACGSLAVYPVGFCRTPARRCTLASY